MTHHLFSAELFSNTSLNQTNQFAQFTKSIKKNLIMQNKPNLCVFWAVSGDCEEKQTQTNPIQTQNKANFDPSAAPQTQNKPNSNPISTPAYRRTSKNCRKFEFYPPPTRKYKWGLHQIDIGPE